MCYEFLLKEIAEQHKNIPEDVDKEIRKAIKCTGMDIEPEMFIMIVSAIVKSRIK